MFPRRARARVDGVEGLGRKAEIDAVKDRTVVDFESAKHGASVAPLRLASSVFLFCSHCAQSSTLSLGVALPLNRIYPVEIIRRFPASELEVPSAAELDRGEEDGVAGNHHYEDLRGVTWELASEVLAEETTLISRFLSAAQHLDVEADQFEDERLDGDDPLYGLDIGVAGAAFALSALGAVPVGSCNAGGFGGHHVASFPLCGLLSRPRFGRDDPSDRRPSRRGARHSRRGHRPCLRPH